MDINWTETALKNLEKIGSYINQDSPFYARVVVSKIYQTALQISIFPKKGRIVPEANRLEIREVFAYSYRIIYKIKPNEILIMRILHMKQKQRRTGFFF